MFYSSLRISPSEWEEKKNKGEKNTTKLERVKKTQSLNQSIFTRSIIQISPLLFTTAAFCFFFFLAIYKFIKEKKKNTLVFKLQKAAGVQEALLFFFSPWFAILLLKLCIFFFFNQAIWQRISYSGRMLTSSNKQMKKKVEFLIAFFFHNRHMTTLRCYFSYLKVDMSQC